MIFPVIHQNRISRGVNVLYEITKISESNGATITTLDDARNNFDGTGVNSPTCEVLSYNGDSIKTYKDETNKAFTLGTPGTTLFNKSFEIWFILSTTDGQMASSIQVSGSRPSDTNRICIVFITSAGFVSVAWGYTGGRVVTITSTHALLDGSNGIEMYRVRVNFEGDSIQVYKNGEVVSNATTEGTIVGKDPALYDNTANIHFGTINANGTLSSNTTASNFYGYMITDKLGGPAGGSQQDTYIESRFIKPVIDTYTQWQNELGVTTGNIDSKRADMVDYLFNGNGMPAGATPAAVNTSYTGLMHGVNTSGLVGAGTVRQIRWDVLDGDSETWTFYQYIIPKASGSTNKWFINHRGHGSEGTATHLTMINRAISEGYDVMFMAMPKGDPDTDGQNTTTNAAVGSHGHEQLYADGVDTASYNALELFFHSQVTGINYLTANYTVSSLAAGGLSGGGYTVSILAAIDTRITKSCAFRGFRPRSSKYYPWIESGHEPDFEQGGANGLQAKCGPRVYDFFTDHPQLEIMAMCTDGGRLHGTCTHVNDTARFGGWSWKAWRTGLETKANELGGRYFQHVSQQDGQSNHEYQPKELERCFYEFAL